MSEKMNEEKIVKEEAVVEENILEDVTGGVTYIKYREECVRCGTIFIPKNGEKVCPACARKR